MQIYVYANDSAGNLNDTTVLNLYKDTSAPNIIVNSPENNTYWNEPPNINIDASDLTLNTIWYKVGSFPIVYLVDNADQTLDEDIWNNLPEGKFILEIFADDEFGHLNDSIKITLYKDTIAPEVKVNSPDQGTYWYNPPLLNVAFNDINNGTLWYSEGSENIILFNNTDQFLESDLWQGFEDGLVLIYVYAMDKAGNINSSIILYLYKDTSAPEIEIYSPTNKTYSNNPPSLKISAYDPNFQSMWYVYGNYKISLINNSVQSLELSIWNELDQGKYYIKIYANDSFGYKDHLVLELYKDTKSPLVEVNSIYFDIILSLIQFIPYG
jgi:hypothetical protein